MKSKKFLPVSIQGGVIVRWMNWWSGSGHLTGWQCQVFFCTIQIYPCHCHCWCYPIEAVCSGCGLRVPWGWLWVLWLAGSSRISNGDSRKILVNWCSFLSISLIFQYWRMLGTFSCHLPWFLGCFYHISPFSSVEAKIFKNKRWAEDGSQLPSTISETK